MRPGLIMIAIIDGHHLFHRVRHISELAKLRRYTGLHTGIVMGFVRSIHGLLVKFPAIDRVHVVFDGGHSERRVQLFPDYKKKEPLSEEEQQRYNADLDQMLILQNSILWRLGCRTYQLRGREGDDLIYQLCQLGQSQQIVVLSGDKDMLQLVGLETMVYDPLKEQAVTFDNFKATTGIANPIQWVWYRAVLGDSSDCIPGVPQVGEKTIKPLLEKRWEQVGELFTEVESGEHGKRAAKLATPANRAIFERNVLLMRLNEEVFTDEETTILKKVYASAAGVSLDILQIFKALSFQELCNQFDSWIAPFQRLK